MKRYIIYLNIRQTFNYLFLCLYFVSNLHITTGKCTCKNIRAGGTGGAGGAIAPPVFFGERTKIYLDVALMTMTAIHHAPPEFSTSRRPCKGNILQICT